jgi:hypothetical protein
VILLLIYDIVVRVFLYMYFFSCLQYLEDDGSCAKLLTREDCLGLKTVLDYDMHECSWHDEVPAVMKYDDYFACRFVSPELSWQVRQLFLRTSPSTF